MEKAGIKSVLIHDPVIEILGKKICVSANQADIQFGFAVILQIEVQGIWIAWIAAMYNNQVPFAKT